MKTMAGKIMLISGKKRKDTDKKKIYRAQNRTTLSSPNFPLLPTCDA